MLTIERVPEDSLLREDIYRLRYDAYVAEKEYRHCHLDHSAKTIQERLDETGHVYAALLDGEVVGTVRTDYSSESELDEYFEHLGVDPAEFPNVSTTSKLAVAAEHRGSTVAVRLAAATYADTLNDGIHYSIIDSFPFLVGLYERLGYRVHHRVQHAPPKVAEGAVIVGETVVMVLDLHDVEHLRRVRSPFLKHYLAWAAQEAVAA